MYSVLVAALDRDVVAVDADRENLAYIRRSLELQNTVGRVRLLWNAVSDQYLQMFPHSPDRRNAGGTMVKTMQELRKENLESVIVRYAFKSCAKIPV